MVIWFQLYLGFRVQPVFIDLDTPALQEARRSLSEIRQALQEAKEAHNDAKLRLAQEKQAEIELLLAMLAEKGNGDMHKDD